MRLGRRSFERSFRALFQRQHYVAAAHMLTDCDDPLDLLRRYLTEWGSYPTTIGLKTPIGPLRLSLHTSHDVLTANEIFCRRDYQADAMDQICVDFGSNIGISAAYFLTRSAASFAYLFEPLPMNIERLKSNLAPFEGRYELAEAAVGLIDGPVDFGWESTGRYGGVGRASASRMTVPCQDSNAVLEAILTRHGRIDILKIDIETLERELTERIPLDFARRIGKIYVEHRFARNPFPDVFGLRQYGSVAQFVALEQSQQRTQH